MGDRDRRERPTGHDKDRRRDGGGGSGREREARRQPEGGRADDAGPGPRGGRKAHGDRESGSSRAVVVRRKRSASSSSSSARRRSRRGNADRVAQTRRSREPAGRNPREVAKRSSSSASSSSSSSSSSSPSEEEKEEVNFGTTGLLATDVGQTYKGRVLKWNTPADMEKTRDPWVLCVLKDGKPLEGKDGTYELKRHPAFMFGRDAGICDIPLAHPSISSQHAVLVFRNTTDGPDSDVKSVKPYLIDLGSTNGTFVNKQQVPASTYKLLRSSDMIKFGTSSRDFILIDSDVI
ncbi:FHA domain-containing protein DDL [Diplonema papillatum]|nr:FHA domain-containing protein DDL [Diplonema papillatum]